MPFIHNGAGRDIRMLEAEMKISGWFSKIEAAKAFSKIRDFISTARKQGV